MDRAESYLLLTGTRETEGAGGDAGTLYKVLITNPGRDLWQSGGEVFLHAPVSIFDLKLCGLNVGVILDGKLDAIGEAHSGTGLGMCKRAKSQQKG